MNVVSMNCEAAVHLSDSITVIIKQSPVIKSYIWERKL